MWASGNYLGIGRPLSVAEEVYVQLVHPRGRGLRSIPSWADGKNGACDWEVVQSLAMRSGCSAVVYHNLGQGGDLPMLPSQIRSTLELFAAECREKLAARAESARALLVALSPHVRRLVVVKGPAAALLYRQWDVRWYNDIDLFLFEEDIPVAKRILRAFGYEQKEMSVSQAEDYEMHAADALPRFVRTNEAPSAVRVEINGPRNHPYLAGTDLGDMIERSVPDERLPSGANRLAWDDAIIVCASHIYCHMVSKPRLNIVRNTAELSAMVEQHEAELDWPHLTEHVLQLAEAQERAFTNFRSKTIAHYDYDDCWQEVPYPDVKASVFFSLGLARSLYGTQVPDRVFSDLFPQRAPHLLDMGFQLRNRAGAKTHSCYRWTVGITERLFDLMDAPLEQLQELGAVNLFATERWMLPIWGAPWSRDMCERPYPLE